MSAFPARASALADAIAERELDLLLVDDLVNIRYLTGFGGTNGLCLAGPKVRAFATDFRYLELARRDLRDWELVEGGRDLLRALIDRARDLHGDLPLRLGFDDSGLTVKQHARLAELAGDSIELVAAPGLVEKLRETKDSAELDAIRRAAKLADEIYSWLVGQHGLTGRSERAVARALEIKALELGTAMSFPPIVACADNGALPHAEPRDIEIPEGTLVVVDMGCVFDGYCSDCTRTFATGAIDAEMTEVYELVRAAQAAALESVRVGATGEQVDAAARSLIDEAGHGDHFGHGTGHGVGLEVHEGPRLASVAKGALEAGNVVTVEPGVYIPGRFGVRIEDLVIVSQAGHEILTGISKELTSV
jgi:Xaa-Pro aminopeptidase